MFNHDYLYDCKGVVNLSKEKQGIVHVVNTHILITPFTANVNIFFPQ